MNKLSLNKLSPKKLSKEGGGIKLPKGIKVNQLVLGVVIVVLLALTVYFAFSYTQGLTTKDGLVNDIKRTETSIAASPPKSISDLKATLNDAVATLSKSTPFTTSVDDTELATQLLEIARDSNTPYFKFYPPSGNTTTAINGSIYNMRSYAIAFGTASTFPKIIYFLKNLEGLPYATSRITEISTSKTEDSWTLSLQFDVILQ